MSAMVEVEIEPPQPRLVISRVAVREREGRYIVLRRGAKGTREQEIAGEPFDDEYFVVEDGLVEGDRVVTLPEPEESP